MGAYMAECDWSECEVRLRAFLVPRTVAPRAAVATTPIDPPRPGPLALLHPTEKALRRTPHPVAGFWRALAVSLGSINNRF
jgi:hypothetical protein